MNAHAIVNRLLETANVRTYYHVTQGSRAASIRSTGLLPKIEKRGIRASEKAPAVYFFDSLDTAEDALTNWLADEYPESESKAVVFAAELNSTELQPDPELAGSFILFRAVKPDELREVTSFEL